MLSPTGGRREGGGRTEGGRRKVGRKPRASPVGAIWQGDLDRHCQTVERARDSSSLPHPAGPAQQGRHPLRGAAGAAKAREDLLPRDPQARVRGPGWAPAARGRDLPERKESREEALLPLPASPAFFQDELCRCPVPFTRLTGSSLHVSKAAHMPESRESRREGGAGRGRARPHGHPGRVGLPADRAGDGPAQGCLASACRGS